jgi:hypothetical protein
MISFAWEPEDVGVVVAKTLLERLALVGWNVVEEGHVLVLHQRYPPRRCKRVYRISDGKEGLTPMNATLARATGDRTPSTGMDKV